MYEQSSKLQKLSSEYQLPYVPGTVLQAKIIVVSDVNQGPVTIKL